ncbi:MAG TPA: PAS domain S-box protein, partial [Clostridia bacterium]|nr:PAS domain S-box protein [Clostridia bacterium]
MIEINNDVTELKRTQEVLAGAKERFDAMITSAMDAIISCNAEQKIVLFNPAAEKMFGITVTEALGRGISDFLPERFRTAHTTHVENFGNTGKTTRHIGKLGVIFGLRRDGEEFPIEASISQVLVGNERLYTVILRDVTERMRAEEARARLAAIVESSEDAILSEDLEGRVTSWNAGAERLFGYSVGEVLGRMADFLIPLGYRTQTANILERLRRGERLEHYETVRLSKDGRPIDVSLTISPIRDASGKMAGISTIIRDITERKQAEAELRDSERVAHARLAELETIYKRAPVGLCFLDSDLRYVKINEQMAQMNGRSVSDHLGRTVREVLPEQADRLEALLQNALKTHTPVMNLEMRSDAGE